jgi:hypothetical protein
MSYFMLSIFHTSYNVVKLLSIENDVPDYLMLLDKLPFQFPIHSYAVILCYVTYATENES